MFHRRCLVWLQVPTLLFHSPVAGVTTFRSLGVVGGAGVFTTAAHAGAPCAAVFICIPAPLRVREQAFVCKYWLGHHATNRPSLVLHPKSPVAVSVPFLRFGTVASGLRQHSTQARRCMALAVASSQALLSTLVAWESETAARIHQSQPAGLTATEPAAPEEASEGRLLTACAAALTMLWTTAADSRDLTR